MSPIVNEHKRWRGTSPGHHFSQHYLIPLLLRLQLAGGVVLGIDSKSCRVKTSEGRGRNDPFHQMNWTALTLVVKRWHISSLDERTYSLSAAIIDKRCHSDISRGQSQLFT